MKIEILYFDGCPHHAQASEALNTVVRELGLETTISPVRIESEDDAVAKRFLGSPSIRVNGHDIAPGADVGPPFSLRCRRYTTEHGVQGFPSEAMIRAAIIAQEKTRG